MKDVWSSYYRFSLIYFIGHIPRLLLWVRIQESPGTSLLPHTIEMRLYFDLMTLLTLFPPPTPLQCMRSDWGLWIRPMLMWNGDWDHTWTQPENASLSALITHSTCTVVTHAVTWGPIKLCLAYAVCTVGSHVHLCMPISRQDSNLNSCTNNKWTHFPEEKKKKRNYLNCTKTK